MKEANYYKQGDKVELIGQSGITLTTGVVKKVKLTYSTLYIEKIWVCWKSTPLTDEIHYNEDFEFIKPIK